MDNPNSELFNLVVSIMFIVPCFFLPLVYLFKILRDFLQINMYNLQKKEAQYEYSIARYEQLRIPISDDRLLSWRLDDGLFIPEMTDEHRKEYADALSRDSKKTLIIMLVPIAVCIILAFINVWVLLVYSTILFCTQLAFFIKSRLNDVKLKICIIRDYPELERFQESHFYKHQKLIRK